MIYKNKDNLRIDKFLLKKISNITRNKIQKSFNTHKIYVNNFLVKKKYSVKLFDIISIMIDYYNLNNTNDISLNILYEDDVLIVLNKPSGITIHNEPGNNKIILQDAVKHHLNKIRVKSETNRTGLVHRLDKETSGLLVIAKNDFSLQHLTYQFFTRSIYRRYIALVWGNLEGYGTMKNNIGRSFVDKRYMECIINNTFGKFSVTHYNSIEKLNIVTLMSCRIDTGRTHQIRAHLTHLGYPIFNDVYYGNNNNYKKKKIVKNCLFFLDGQFLYAQSFIFIHPITGKLMHFEIPLPKNMYNILELIRNNKYII